MQSQLDQYSSDLLIVYAVWIPMLGSDSREAWEGNVLPDPRVMDYWDGEYVTGPWFAKEVEGYRGIAWDVYYLYGPDATWENIPEPLEGSGGTIYRERETLKTQLLALFNQ